MKTKDLKPCPFCGSVGPLLDDELEDGLVVIGDTTNNRWNVHCCQCYTDGPVFETQKGAMSAWNRREGE